MGGLSPIFGLLDRGADEAGHAQDEFHTYHQFCTRHEIPARVGVLPSRHLLYFMDDRNSVGSLG